MFEPITLFKAIAGEPVKAAFKLTKSSGADVAKLTTVIPITILETFNLKDKATDERTKNSPPTTKSNNPKMIQNKLMQSKFLRRYYFI